MRYKDIAPGRELRWTALGQEGRRTLWATCYLRGVDEQKMKERTFC